MTDEEQDIQRLVEHSDQLAEHFDTVQIFCTRHEAGKEDGTVAVNQGAGNWFARVGQVKEWIVKKDEEARTTARNEP